MEEAQPALSLKAALAAFNQTTPESWLACGVGARRDLHGLIRYPAMMVPSMQADILDAILGAVGRDVHIVDPFVGSGTVMTEAMRRGLHFTGVDINPLAILACQAKAAIEAGIALDAAVVNVLEAVKRDWHSRVEVRFDRSDKWFAPHQLLLFSRFRRAICGIDNRAKRQCLWVAFAETIRTCSRTRTSTYKLHIRPEDDVVDEETIVQTFEANLYGLLGRAMAYREDRGLRDAEDPHPELICAGIEQASFKRRGARCIVITSPPYGDNRTTIPYGQFSYLPLNWIPRADLPRIPVRAALKTTGAIDTASLGGSLKDADAKTEKIEALSPTMRTFFATARATGKAQALRKVGVFLWDYYGALKCLRKLTGAPSHWVVTLGNRTSAGVIVPFDEVCREFVTALGGTCLEVVERRPLNKRMPNRNSQGAMITAETALVASFD